MRCSKKSVPRRQEVLGYWRIWPEQPENTGRSGVWPVLKEGPIEDFKNRDRIAKLLRFPPLIATPTFRMSLEDYVGRMKEGQDKIYYITAESFAAAKNSPHLEVFRRKGLEVLLLRPGRRLAGRLSHRFRGSICNRSPRAISTRLAR